VAYANGEHHGTRQVETFVKSCLGDVSSRGKNPLRASNHSKTVTRSAPVSVSLRHKLKLQANPARPFNRRLQVKARCLASAAEEPNLLYVTLKKIFETGAGQQVAATLQNRLGPRSSSTSPSSPTRVSLHQELLAVRGSSTHNRGKTTRGAGKSNTLVERATLDEAF